MKATQEDLKIIEINHRGTAQGSKGIRQWSINRCTWPIDDTQIPIL